MPNTNECSTRTDTDQSAPTSSALTDQSARTPSAHRAVDIGGEQQVERQRRQQVHNEPALQVVGGDVARTRHHLPLFVDVGRAEVEDDVCGVDEGGRGRIFMLEMYRNCSFFKHRKFESKSIVLPNCATNISSKIKRPSESGSFKEVGTNKRMRDGIRQV